MKKIVILLVFISFAKTVSAQKELLSFNEQNKYTYFQVITQAGSPVDTLQARALYFLKKNYPKDKIKQADTAAAFTGADKFLVYNGVSLTRHIAGEINYTINIVCKDQKYKYWLTDFIFIPYKMDRYGNDVPENGIEIPLEKASSILEKKALESYLDQTGAYCKNSGIKLKQYMLNISALPKETNKKTISTKDW